VKNSPDDTHRSLSETPPDALRAWTLAHRDRFDTLQPAPNLWAALEQQLDAAAAATAAPRATAEPDALRAWAQQNRPAFDTFEPRTNLWGAIERALDAPPVVVASSLLTATRGGQYVAPNRWAWGRMAAAAVVLLGLGYGLRVGTEPRPVAADVALVTATEPTVNVGAASDDESSQRYSARPLHGFRNQEPDPALQAAMLTHGDETDELPAATADARMAAEPESSVELARLEARYYALLADRQQDRAAHRPARPLADEWDREMALLDSTYAELRHALPTHPKPDEVVAAMTRNLHLRAELLTKQEHALNAAQHARQQRTNRLTPRRPPTVNPEDNGVNFDDLPSSSGGTLVPPAPPAPEPMPGLGAGLKKRPSKMV
jgi:hypothetical protein